MVALWHVNDRTRFIVRRGVLRFGLAIGALAAWLGAVPPDQVAGNGSGHVLAVLLAPMLAFLEWGIGGGWIIGALLWSFRPHDAARATREAGKGDTRVR